MDLGHSADQRNGSDVLNSHTLCYMLWLDVFGQASFISSEGVASSRPVKLLLI